MTFQTNFPLEPTKLPYVTVSAKGMSNGLSDIPNDGFDFGPDTMLNATSKDQYGPPYTQTSGIQEAWNYSVNIASNFPPTPPRSNFLHKIVFTDGVFYISKPITLTAPFQVDDLYFQGQGMMPTYIGTTSGFSTSDNMITLDPNIFSYSNLVFSHMQFFGNCNTYLYADFSSANTNENTFQLENVNIAGSNNGSYVIYLNALGQLYTTNYQDYSATGSYFNGYGMAYLGILHNGPLNISGFGTVYLPIPVTGNSLIFSNIWIVRISVLGFYNPMYINGNIENFDIGTLTTDSPYALFNTQSSSQVTINNLHIGILDILANTNAPFTSTNLIKFNNISIDNINLGSGASLTSYPLQSTTNGTTAGTVFMNGVKYTQKYKKYMITFSGYENDTTTNQTISYPLPFSTSAVISANNTGLTISTTTSGITITSPNSTTTYSGIVIVEGY